MEYGQMKSMTGYGEAVGQGKRAKVVVQLRTLNHRHLDIQLRVPRMYLSLEEEIRQRIRQRVNRGRVDLFITRYPLKGQGRKLEMDEGLMDQYFQALRRARRKLGLKDKIDLDLLSKLPDLFYFKENDDLTGGERSLVLRTLEAAAKNLDNSRKREGGHLKGDIQGQIRGLQKIYTELKVEAVKILKKLHVSTHQNLEGDGNDVSKGLNAGNAALKFDINEEVVRLRSHVDGLLGLIRQRGPAGKKVDFLLQEVQREINTIGSKVPHLPVIRLVLSGKEKVEKIREQVQNVE